MALSLVPSPPQLDVQEGDKLGHLLAYAVLMAWFCFLYRGARARLAHGIAFVLMGIGLEIVQGGIGRSDDPLDMTANAIGVLLGWALAAAAPRIVRR